MTDSLASNSQFSHFTVERRIAAGGMGEIYLAMDTRLERRVALKVLPPQYTRDVERVNRFVQEAKAVSSLNHPHIVTIYEIGQEGPAHYISAEYVDGRTIREILQDGQPFSVLEAVDIILQVAGALVAAHQKGIVHRDLKPENIMVRTDGNAKVLDFGLAKLTEIDDRGTSSEMHNTVEISTDLDVVMGTARYMSPEQARGAVVDARSDVFSLGGVLYEMLSGRPPFSGATTADVLAAIVRSEPPPLNRVRQDIPEELQRIVGKALRKDREERYQTMKDLRLDVKSLREEMAGSAPSSGRFAATPSDPREVSSGSGSSSPLTPGSGPNLVPAAAQDTSGISTTRSAGGKLALPAAVAVLLVLAFAALYVRLTSDSGDVIDSIAVLPFTNTSGDPAAEYLSDGVTESLINSLSQISQLKVIARSAVYRYRSGEPKGTPPDAKAAGLALGVRAILTGRVLQRDDTLTVSAELVDARDERQLWGQQYSRKLTDLFAVQQDIAREISGRLRLTVSGDERRRLARRHTDDTAAYQLYLKGRYYWNRRNQDGLKRAIEYFNEAISKDPGFALAYAGLSDSYGILPTYSDTPARDAFPRAKAAALKALEIDDSLAEAHTSLAMVKNDFDWDFRGAEREYQRAIELNPSYATAYHWSGENFMVMGRYDEAIARMKRAQELDPLSLIIGSALGWFYYKAGRPELAAEQCRKAIEMDAQFAPAHWYLGMAYEQEKHYDLAIEATRKALQLAGNASTYLSSLGYTLAVAGRKQAAENVLSELTRRASAEYVSPSDFAKIYIGMGQKGRAFEWMEKAIQARDPRLIYNILNDPQSAGLRSDARYADFVRRAGLPQ